MFLGALTVGVLDILDAFVFVGLRGVPLIRVPQGIAAGLLGREAARAGGLSTAALGMLLHFCIATTVVATYFFASRRLPFLVRRPWLYGPLYGLVVWGVMNFVVIPLSAIPSGPRALSGIINGILIHLVGVGLPSALFARAALAREAAP